MGMKTGECLKIEGIYKSFGSRVVLNGVNLEVEPGQVLGFVGANGAGKTTTMRIIMGITGPDRGTVTFGKNPLDFQVRSAIGYMPEERGLYPRMKVEEQLVYFARLHGLEKSEARKSARQWMERLGVVERKSDLLEKLSLGNQQRVQLAAALVHDPVALILDEPFSGLDPIAVDVMSRVLRDYAERGVPVIFSSHQLALVEELCTHVAIISDGTIVANGEVEALRRESTNPMVRLLGDERAVDAGRAQAKILNHSVQEMPDGITIDTAAENLSAREILQAAVRAGTVTEFSPVRPTLAEIFRSVVEPEVAS